MEILLDDITLEDALDALRLVIGRQDNIPWSEVRDADVKSLVDFIRRAKVEVDE